MNTLVHVNKHQGMHNGEMKRPVYHQELYISFNVSQLFYYSDSSSNA